MTILSKIDKFVYWFERMDSPLAKAIMYIFLLFVAVYFSVPVIRIFSK